MKVYLAVSMTNSHDPMFLKRVIDHIHGLGHQVLSEHVATATKEESIKVLAKNAGLTPESLTEMGEEDIALLIRNTDFRWVEECDAFIALFFGGSDGRGAEFEHLRLLMELKRSLRLGGPGHGHLFYEDRLCCRGILGLFDEQACSSLIWAANNPEKKFYRRVFVDPDDTGAILSKIKEFLSEMEEKGENQCS